MAGPFDQPSYKCIRASPSSAVPKKALVSLN